MPQASEEYGPICHYYVVVVPENTDTALMNPDEFLNQKVGVVKIKMYMFYILTRKCLFLVSRNFPTRHIG